MTKKTDERPAEPSKSTELDLDALSLIESEQVQVGGQTVTMTMLVPEDVERCRKLVKRGKLDEDLAMEYLTFLSMQKAHPEVSWYKFQKLNFKVVNKLMAVMAVLNGFDETFQIFGRNGDAGSSGSSESDDQIDMD